MERGWRQLSMIITEVRTYRETGELCQTQEGLRGWVALCGGGLEKENLRIVHSPRLPSQKPED